jgi:hypothetical protein
MWRQGVQWVLGQFGFELRRVAADGRPGNGRPGPAAADPLAAEIDAAATRVARNTLLSRPRLSSLYRQVAHLERHRVAGCLVECGVWKGGAVGLMALANLRHGAARRHLHLFDAFQEICEPDPERDGERIFAELRELAGRPAELKGRLEPIRGVYDRFGGPGTLSENRALLEERLRYPAAFLHYHVGWFQQTVPRDAESLGPIALLRLDGDLYHSTRVCLEHLYPRVVPGGFVIVDDYGRYEGCTRAVDEYLDARDEPAFLAPAAQVADEHAYWIKPAVR